MNREEGDTVPKQLLDKISIYVPKNKVDQNPVERLIKLADEKDRSVNYLVVEAILDYLSREEKKK
jgi:predicted transcriptional regulator